MEDPFIREHVEGGWGSEGRGSEGWSSEGGVVRDGAMTASSTVLV